MDTHLGILGNIIYPKKYFNHLVSKISSKIEFDQFRGLKGGVANFEVNLKIYNTFEVSRVIKKSVTVTGCPEHPLIPSIAISNSAHYSLQNQRLLP